MDVVSPLVADREPAVLGKPGQRTFYDPPVPTEFPGAFYTLSRYPYLDAALTQSLSAFLGVVSFVGVQFLRALSGSPSTRALDRLDAVYQLLENHRVMGIGTSEHDR